MVLIPRTCCWKTAALGAAATVALAVVFTAETNVRRWTAGANWRRDWRRARGAVLEAIVSVYVRVSWGTVKVEGARRLLWIRVPAVQFYILNSVQAHSARSSAVRRGLHCSPSRDLKWAVAQPIARVCCQNSVTSLRISQPKYYPPGILID